MRVFIAIDIDEATKKAIQELQQELASKVDIRKSDVKWVRPDAIHLTLKFLGEIKDESVVEVCRIVEEAVKGHKSFDIELETVGYFGGRSARVLWVGCGAGSDKLLRLQEDTELRLADAGWPKEQRKFTGHLTLCRVRNSSAGVKLARVTDACKDRKVGVIEADSVVVYQSRLHPTGPVYTQLGNYKLQNRT